jgi:hypothetical protein
MRDVVISSLTDNNRCAVRLLSLRDLEARSGGVSHHTWRLWARQRRFPVVRLGRRLLVRESDFAAFVEANLQSDSIIDNEIDSGSTRTTPLGKPFETTDPSC